MRVTTTYDTRSPAFHTRPFNVISIRTFGALFAVKDRPPTTSRWVPRVTTAAMPLYEVQVEAGAITWAKYRMTGAKACNVKILPFLLRRVKTYGNRVHLYPKKTKKMNSKHWYLISYSICVKLYWCMGLLVILQVHYYTN